MEALNHQALIDELIAISLDAGKAIMDYYQGHIEREIKEDGSPLTQADLASHEIIEKGLTALTPNIPVISEESSDKSQVNALNQRCWLVDPLDGTKEFIHQNGEFTTNIALIENNRTVLGVIYAPAIDTLYVGSNTGIAFKVMKGEQTSLATHKPDENGVIVFGSRSHQNQQALSDFLTDRVVKTIEPCGSSLKLCRIADGSGHLYPRLGPTMLWDIAAGQAILEAAGGQVTTLKGETLSYHPDNLKNPPFLASHH